jgi:hypothetical protein
MASFRAEQTAREEFASCAWLTPWVAYGWNWYLQRWFACPCYPEANRLDRLAPSLDRRHRLELLHDLHTRRFAHRDFRAKHLFYVGGQLRLIDFDTLTVYPDDYNPPFEECYDVTGVGLHSPALTRNMGYSNSTSPSVSTVLGIPFAQAQTHMLSRGAVE